MPPIGLLWDHPDVTIADIEADIRAGIEAVPFGVHRVAMSDRLRQLVIEKNGGVAPGWLT